MESTVNESGEQKSARRSAICVRLQFSLRSMLVMIFFAALVFGFYEPVKLHFQAVSFLKEKNTGYATDPSPERLFYNVVGFQPGQPDRHVNDVLVHVEKVRIVLLGRRHDGGLSGLIPVAGNVPQSNEASDVNGKPIITWSYAAGEAKCDVFGLPFTCRGREIEINNQSFDLDKSTVVLVDIENETLHTHSGQE